MSRARLVVATGNPGKLREFRALLAPLDIGVDIALDTGVDIGVGIEVCAPQEPIAYPEEGDDYAANALAKARTASTQLGVAALADDSGLEVDALDGEPGPHSARYGGPDLDDRGRVAHLLEALARTPRSERTARFVCHAALVEPGGEVVTAMGSCAGRILTAPRGARGFGYDPVFWVPDRGAAMAELPASIKNRISHRARAVAALADALAALQSRAKISSGDG
jgi:XTP/dITP diphosphohydrolase